jgi:hypothetical protein
MNKGYNPGQTFWRTYPDGCRFLVVLLSKEPDSPWVCAEFQKCGANKLLGAQVVKYDESELSAFESRGLTVLGGNN